jgi:hypothetical protein
VGRSKGRNKGRQKQGGEEHDVERCASASRGQTCSVIVVKEWRRRRAQSRPVPACRATSLKQR